MAVTIKDADEYIEMNVIHIEDWTDADEAKKQRILNVASRTLTSRFSMYTIPDAAVYEFAAVLATQFNDTLVQAKNGVQALSITGVASFTFRECPTDLGDLIPPICNDLIGEANDVVIGGRRRVGWSVL